MKLRAALLVASCGALGSCGMLDAEEVKICEASLKAGLKAPATYKRAEVTSLDTGPLTQAQFDEEVGRADTRGNPSAEQLRLLQRDLAKGKTLGLRTVAIAYDAENAFGVPLRAAKVCVFRTLDGKPQTSGTGGSLDASAGLKHSCCTFN